MGSWWSICLGFPAAVGRSPVLTAVPGPHCSVSSCPGHPWLLPVASCSQGLQPLMSLPFLSNFSLHPCVSSPSPMVGNPKSRWLLGPPSLPRDQRVVQSRPLPEGIFEEGPHGPPLGGGWAKVYIGVVARASPACPEPPCLLWRLHSKWVIPKPVLGTPTPSAPSASVPPPKAGGKGWPHRLQRTVLPSTLSS